MNTSTTTTAQTSTDSEYSVAYGSFLAQLEQRMSGRSGTAAEIRQIARAAGIKLPEPVRSNTALDQDRAWHLTLRDISGSHFPSGDAVLSVNTVEGVGRVSARFKIVVINEAKTAASAVTEADVQAAYKVIDEMLLAGFTYASPTDKAAHLAYLLTAVNRGLMNESVGFAAKGPRASGKTVALAVGRVLAQGNDGFAPFGFSPADDAMTTKSLSRLLTSGGRFLHSEKNERRSKRDSNVALGVICDADGGDFARILGGSGMVPISGIIVTAEMGTHETLDETIGARFLAVNLAGPAARQPDFLGFVERNRGELVAALRTLFQSGQDLGAAHDIPDVYAFTHNWSKGVLCALSGIRDGDGPTFAELIIDRVEQEAADRISRWN